MTEYFNGITFASMKRLPEEWRENPPVDLIMAFGMASISHIWTGFCTPTIIVRAGFLRPEDVAFWQETFTLGLAEHFLVNQIRTLKPGTPRCLRPCTFFVASNPTSSVMVIRCLLLLFLIHYHPSVPNAPPSWSPASHAPTATM